MGPGPTVLPEQGVHAYPVACRALKVGRLAPLGG
jgi:hypothetical protein